VAVAGFCCPLSAADPLSGNSAETGPFGEAVRWSRLESGIRVCTLKPASPTDAPIDLVIYATPNGNTIEQTLGCAPAADRDWRVDIQHVAAQVRRFRELTPDRATVLVVVESPKLSWPAFRQSAADAGLQVRTLVETLVHEFQPRALTLTGHSGGGSFLFGYINAVEAIPAVVERIAFLDANYAYTDDARHGDKLLTWLQGDPQRRLVVVAYDDREITLNGKKVVGPDGGTWRASQRMLDRLRCDLPLETRTVGPFQQTTALGGRIEFDLHPNPENRILHTALVGEMNGLLHALTLGAESPIEWGALGGPRAYGRWVQPDPWVEPRPLRAVMVAGAPAKVLPLPPRLDDAPTGSEFIASIAALSRADRESAILKEITRGNVPNCVRPLVPLRVTTGDAPSTQRTAVYFVMPDYLAIGSDADFVRMPMAAATAEAIADLLRCTLITRKVSDDVHAAAHIRLEPRPLTAERESPATFLQHHRLIESQWPPDTGRELTAGIKKDLVWTNRLTEKPHRVALYGWHYEDGRPIQSLYVGHVDWYVDYSHGVRLMARDMEVDGQPCDSLDLLRNPLLHGLLSDEGPIDVAELRRASGRSWEK
jgi:hypothetical protein